MTLGAALSGHFFLHSGEGSVNMEGSHGLSLKEGGDDAEVHVHEHLKEVLKKEVDDVMVAAGFLSRSGRIRKRPAAAELPHEEGRFVRCPLCPFKTFSESSVNAKRDFVNHIQRHHSCEKVASQSGKARMAQCGNAACTRK